MEKDNPAPGFNDLVVEAMAAQEDFDMFDPRDEGDHDHLRELSRAWTKANIALLDYAVENEDALREHWEKEE